MLMKFLFDLSKVKHQHLVDLALKDWTVTKHSERCLEVSGRQWTSSDIGRLWQANGRGGHVFVVDLQNGQEYYRQKLSLGERKRQTARDRDLDAQTLQSIVQFQKPANLPEAPR